MKWKVVLVLLLLLISCFILPATAKKDKNESSDDDSNFSHIDPSVTLSAYEIKSNGERNDTKLKNDKPTLNKNTVVEFQSLKGNTTKKDIVFVFKKSFVRIYNNSSRVMQYSRFPQSPFFEVYYGYARSLLEPWQYYYRIDECNADGICKYVRADFRNKSVSIGYANETDIQSIIDSGVIPEYNALP